MANNSPPFPFRNYLPVPDDTVSTRGQRLSSLIRDRSFTSLKDLRAQYAQRRLSMYNDDEEQGFERGSDGTGEERNGRGSKNPRKMSDGSQILMTPQMRSMRLIGNSNPRYQWWVCPMHELFFLRWVGNSLSRVG